MSSPDTIADTPSPDEPSSQTPTPEAKEGEPRRPPSHTAVRAPLVGRGPELRELDEALSAALRHHTPQAVSILAGPGMGKTRLVQEFAARVRSRERRVQVLRGVCRQNGAAFGAIQRILRARFGVLQGAEEEETRDRFRTQVTEALGDQRVTEFLHFLGAFLDLRFPESPFIRAVEDDRSQFGLVSRAVLRRFFEVDAERRPLVLTFEDLHWAPDDTLDLVGYLLEALHDAPILVVCTARPELLARRPDWMRAGGEHHARLALGPLTEQHAASLVTHLLEPAGGPADDPPEPLVDAAVQIARGNPYLLEQMVRTFHESGTLVPREEGEGWDVHLEKLEDAQLPLSVEDAISARVSSLSPAERELLEMAATLGSVFWLGALVAMQRIGAKTPELWGGHESTAAHIQDLLDGLCERDFVIELPGSSIPGETELAFMHNLEREFIHRLTDRVRACRYHQVAGEWLEYRLAERAEEQCEMLAVHFEQGEARHKAALYFILAGNKARARYANVKAAEYYARGLELLGDADVTARVEGLHHYGDVLQLAGRNEEAERAFREMLDIAFRLDLKSMGGAAHNRLGRLYRSIGRLDDAMRHLGTGHALFDAVGDRRGVASSFDDVGKVHWMRGNYEAAERFIQQGLEIRQQFGDSTEGKRSIALSYNNLGLVYQDSGHFAEARTAFEEALLLRRDIDDKPGIAQTLNNLGTIHQYAGDHPRAVALYEEALDVAREVGDRMRQAVVLTNLGESRYRMEHPREAIGVLEQAEEIAKSLGDSILEGEVLRALAKAHMLIHDLPEARAYAARAVALFEEGRAKPYLGVALRTQAEVFAAAGWGGGEDHARARTAFRRSVEIFEELGNEVELAASCAKCAQFLEAHPDYASDDALREEAQSLRSRADTVREKQRTSDEDGLPPLQGEKTNPEAPHPQG